MHVLNLPALLTVLLVGCAPTVHFTDGPPQQVADMAITPDLQPPPDMITKPPVRISKLDDVEFWWWSNPNSPGEPDYATYLNGPLWMWENSEPSGYKPHFDNQLRAKCLFYWTADQKWRCLPGWAQFKASLPLNGFYETGSWQCPLVPRDSWVQALPKAANESNLQPYLVVYDTQAKGFRAYKKIPVHTDVWVYIPGKYCTKAWDDINDTLSFYEIGDEVPLSTFAEPVNPGTPE